MIGYHQTNFQRTASSPTIGTSRLRRLKSFSAVATIASAQASRCRPVEGWLKPQELTCDCTTSRLEYAMRTTRDLSLACWHTVSSHGNRSTAVAMRATASREATLDIHGAARSLSPPPSKPLRLGLNVKRAVSASVTDSSFVKGLCVRCDMMSTQSV